MTTRASPTKCDYSSPVARPFKGTSRSRAPLIRTIPSMNPTSRNAKQITCRTRFGARVLFAFSGMNNADSAPYAALKSLGTQDGALTTAFHVYWVVRKVPGIAFYFTQSATTGFIASVFPSRSRVSFKEAFAGPELCDWKLSCTVLRGLDSSNGVRLLGKLSGPVLRGLAPSNGGQLLGETQHPRGSVDKNVEGRVHIAVRPPLPLVLMVCTHTWFAFACSPTSNVMNAPTAVAPALTD